MKVLYIGPYKDGTGWGQAAINNILSLDAAGVEVVPRALKLNSNKVELPERVKELEENSDKGCDIVIQNSLPHHMEYNGNFKKNIAYIFLETSNFRNSSWAEYLNLMNECWVPCIHNDYTCRESGVDVPLHVIPQGCDTSKYQQVYEPLPIPHLKNKCIFYTIGEVNRRKNLVALIKAYHLAFKPDDEVELVIKGNVPGAPANKVEEHITYICNETKEQLKLYNKKSTYLSETIISQNLTEKQLYSLHQMCYCYVSPSFGEGWNIPLFDAMGFGKYVIASKTGAHVDFIEHKENGFLTGGRYESVTGMKDTFGDIYVGNEFWFNVDVNELVAQMQRVYSIWKGSHTDQILFGKIPENAANTVYNYSYQSIGQKMKKRLENE